MVGKSFEIPEKFDESGLGADLEILAENQILEESNELYPGIAVKQFGFIPIGSCLVGSGDPYFIKTVDGLNSQLYRIYHDCGDEENFDTEKGIVSVLDNIQELLNYKLS